MSNKTKSNDVMAKLTSLCKRRGIIFQSSEIYGGVGATYDYGPYGVEIKNSIARKWWVDMTHWHDNIVGLDSAILLHPKVWEASGHVQNFNDPKVDCKVCKARFREDELPTPADGNTQCPKCGSKNSFTEMKQFNLMFKTDLGSTDETSSVGYFRPETCQGIYLDYKLAQDAARLKLPFGIAQIGKAFRNEITTGNFIFRTREFEQMEMQYFVKPNTSEPVMKYWIERRFEWHKSLGIEPNKLRLAQHPANKLAHYAKDAWDIEFEFPFGWGEIEGIHDRGDWDLSQHQKHSGKDLTWFDDETRERYTPNIVETSVGLNRTMLMVLCNAYREDVQSGEERVYLALHPDLAPIKASILPLLKKDGLFELSHGIYEGLRKKWRLFFDEQGSIGRRYRRMDEIGTPFAFTIDYQTKEDNTVTVRWRDDLKQERINIDQIDRFLFDNLNP